MFWTPQIKTIVLKGAMLAETVYPNIALRSMGDIDLLIHKDDLDRAAKRILELGYIFNEHYRSAKWYIEPTHKQRKFI